ncbi:hypothetical protein COLSTE_02303 [Collinsella stercoris DSM 13279]|uniref:Uncharacterized protein n=1 Tax=Collinsella stercoris DSM 13279 TaxID=445975 RepID=B6GDV7_9ACTN|nr:hypothetical protein COLSTE_02303 [Collinsella stercoris DSM 13279]
MCARRGSSRNARAPLFYGGAAAACETINNHMIAAAARFCSLIENGKKAHGC